ncbi:rab GTPase-binding effector protein 1 isoform X1 [Petromyzon marinus]|uniref:rab GTPase-binding effector protein 1 isoform X1 n=1 Tax=Petromyzon marinus TaxID=7757 RepID=UPI003F71B12D
MRPTASRPAEAPQDPAASTSPELQRRVRELEESQAALLKEKQQLEADFSQKRAKFKELYLAKEDELKHSQAQLTTAQEEVENIKAVATVTESTKQEALDHVRGQWQEEVASLQAAMKETLGDYEMQWHAKLDSERASWAQHRESWERELADLRRQLAESTQEENLETEMKKAQEDAEKLRSVVMPMEQEISSLKSRLTAAQEHARQLEDSRVSQTASQAEEAESREELGDKVKELNHYLETEKACRTDLEMYVAVLNTQKTVLQEDAERLRRELHEVCRLLELEKQQHAQLKQTWHRANDQFLESQRALVRDARRLQAVLTAEQLRQVEARRRKEQVEEKREQERRQKAKAAAASATNESHPKSSLSASVDDVRTPLPQSASPGSDGLRRVQSSDSLGARVVVEGSEAREHALPPPDPNGAQATLPHEHLTAAEKSGSDSNLDEMDFGPMVSADLDLEGFDTSSVTSELSNFIPDGAHSMMSMAPHAEALGASSVDGGAAVVQGPAGFMLTRAQELSIKARTPEQEETASLLSTVTMVSTETLCALPDGYRLVSEREWDLLQEEVQKAASNFGRPCDMCSNYEQQLQTIQAQEADTRDQLKRLHAMLRQANEQLEKVGKERDELEDASRRSAEDCTEQIVALTEQCRTAEALLQELQQKFVETQQKALEQLAVLARSREQVAEELRRLQADNDSLQGKHSVHQSLLQAEGFIMPSVVQELQALVSQYRRDMVAVRTACEHAEERLRAEILFLREQLTAEQGTKDNLESTLQLEIDTYKEEIASITSIRTEVERLKSLKEELEKTVQEKTQQLERLEQARRQLEGQHREEHAQRLKLEEVVREEKSKTQRLQNELDTSEQVQRDFVKLSQTLQVQLERIRQMESMEQVREILNSTDLSDVSQLPDT